MSSAPPFGIIIPSRPVLVNPVIVSATQYAFSFPSTPAFGHIVLFLLPGNTLPVDTLAGIYIQLPGSAPDFKLLGALGTEKQSALFRVTAGSGTAEEGTASGPAGGNGVVEEMSDVDATSTTIDGNVVAGDITVGISIEPTATITAQLETLNAAPWSTALVVTQSQQKQITPLSTKVLAQRIIKNAFNFLASFAGTSGGQEVVPLKSFENWWSKFERRIENDPGFLEREADS